MKILALVFAFLVIFSSPAPAQEKIEGLDISWPTNEKNLGSFDSIAIYGIDLRELCLKVKDMDGEMGQRCPDAENIEIIGTATHQRFTEDLKKIKPVVESETAMEKVIPDSKMLYLTLKVAVDLEIEELGPLMAVLTPGESSTITKPARILFQCDIRPAGSKKDLVILKDSQDITFTDPKKPFSTPEDSEKLYELIDVWSRRVSIFLEKESPASEPAKSAE